jgi:hypothetical protein
MNFPAGTALLTGDPTPAAGRQGIAYIGVQEGPKPALTVTFVLPIALLPVPYLLRKSSYALTGGVRMFPRITGIMPVPGDPASAVLELDTIGDFSVYTLTATAPELDPLFASRTVRFRLACDDPYDCEPPAAAPASAFGAEVAIDYLAKDYVSFRRALFDLAATRFPAWIERNEADLGVSIAELFAHTADTLSYQQDRVANEAFLATALERRSVAGHLALVGYALDEGASAWTFLHVRVNGFVTLRADAPLQVGNVRALDDDPSLVFETLGSAALRAEHNAFDLYTWGHSNCTVPAGALSAALIGEYPALRAGDYLAFVAGGTSDVVRLVADALIVTPPGGVTPPPFVPTGPAHPPHGDTTYTVVRWSARTPLHAAYDATTTRVLGNVVPATHGRTVPVHSLDAAKAASFGRHARVRLPDTPLVFLDASTLALAAGAPKAADGAIASRTRRSISSLRLTVNGVAWTEVLSLLEARPNQPVFTLQVAGDGSALLLFGDGLASPALPRDAHLQLSYRTGGGSGGNVARGVLATLLHLPGGFAPDPHVAAVENVVAASGGRDRESAEHAKRYGPRSFLQPLVAVTTDDYAKAALEATDADGAPLVKRAQAAFRWTGSWLTVTLALDPVGGAIGETTRTALLAQLESRRLAGYDLELVLARPVPLELDVELCVKPGTYGPAVAADVGAALVAFFAPRNFSFGDAVYVSRIYAAIFAVPGVSTATIVTLARYRGAHAADETAANLAAGKLRVGHDEIVRLDDDRDFPENGMLSVTAIGTGA